MKASEISDTEYFLYYKAYIDLVDDIPLLESLKTGLMAINSFFKNIPESKLEFRYSEGKWTPKEILLHLIDTERVFCYRALYYARNAGSVIEGFDENIFAGNSRADSRDMDDLLNEYISVRNSTIHLFTSFDEEVLKNGGFANGNPLSVRSIGFIICGHEIHHGNIIQERYL